MISVVTCSTPERVRNGMLDRCILSVDRQTMPVEAHLVGVDHGKRDQAVLTNSLVRAVDTEWLLVLDDDDWLETNYVERMLPHVDNADLIYPYAWTQEDNPRAELLNRPWSPDDMRRENFIAGGVLMRTQLFRDLGGRVLHDTQNGDWIMWCAAIDAGARFLCVPEKLFNYRYHDKQKTWSTT